MNLSSKIIRVTLLRSSFSLSRCISTTPHYLVAVRLAEVGRIDTPKLTGKYETGQLFLHRVFGYRGVILFPWVAKVYDRDGPSKSLTSTPSGDPAESVLRDSFDMTSSENNTSLSNPTDDSSLATDTNTSVGSPTTPTTSSSSSSDSEVSSTAAAGEPLSDTNNYQINDSYMSQITKDNIKGTAHTYYQVLIDARDCQYLKLTKKAQTEAVTFLGNQDNGRTLYAVPGLDYVAHEDVMPFTAADHRPIRHELFSKFLQKVPDPTVEPSYEARETLRAWQQRNHPWLELSDVHKEITENVRVTVIPFYMGCREAHTSQTSDVYWWRYCIRLENLGSLAVQLRERHWRIFSLSGTLETVRGRGVVGSEPILSSADPAFQYSSHVSLQSPSGHMWGTFRMEREDGYTFECRIPPFSLESKQGDSSAPSPTSD